MTLEELLDALEGVRAQGGQYVARCPSHDDERASLAVRQADDGSLLVYCHAGCAAADVMAAIGRSLADLSPARKGGGYGEPEASYLYVDEGGSPLYEHLRFPGKRFRTRRYDPGSPDAKEDGYVWNLKDVRRVPYRLPELIAAVREGRRVYIVEGEKDADRITLETGRTATTNPGGAGKWREEFNRFFYGARVIVIQDRDEAGRRHAARIVEDLQGIAAEVLLYQAKRGKDISDHFDHGLRMEEMQRPRVAPSRGIVSAGQMADSGLEYLALRERDLPGWQLLEGVEGSIVRPGRLYACGAYTGDGKTTFALQGARKLASEGVHVGYFTLEMSDTDLRNRLVAHEGIPLWVLERPWRLRRDPAMLRRYREALDRMRDWNLDVIYDTQLKPERVVAETYDREYEFVVIDHVHRFGWGERRQFEAAIQTLTNLTLDANVGMLILCQLRRYQRGRDLIAYPPPVLQDFRETEMLGNEASLAYALWRQRDQEGLRYIGNQTQFRVLKNRHTTRRGDAAGHVDELGFDTATLCYQKGVISGEAVETDWDAAVTKELSEAWE